MPANPRNFVDALVPISQRHETKTLAQIPNNHVNAGRGETFIGLSATGRGVVVAVALVDTTVVLAGGGKATEFAVLVDGVDDPVDAGVLADSLVLGVDKDDLELRTRKLAQRRPTRSSATERRERWNLSWLTPCRTVGGTLRHRALATTAADADTHQFSCSAYLPAANTEKEAQDIRLLLLLELFDVFEGTHLLQLSAIVTLSRRMRSIV
ncbi:hypothetical protein KCV00_g393, partial [Aureobasidium melanogenum]